MTRGVGARREPGSWLDRAWPWVLGGLLFLLAAHGVLDYGLTWDEPTYFRFARLQRDWILGVVHGLFAPSELPELFSSARIEQVWLQHGEKNGHPPLNETWQGLVGAVFRRFGWDDLRSFRTAIALLFGLTGVALYSLLRTGVRPLAATAGVLVLVGVPSVWAHAHLAATECMQIFFWVVLAISGARALTETGSSAMESPRTYRWRFGGWVKHRWLVLWALAAAASFNAKFANFLAVLWVLAAAILAGGFRPRRFWLVAAVGIAACPLGLLFFDPFFWPWSGGWPRFADYMGQVGSRVEWIPIAVYYMGKNWGFSPPWHYRIVETVTTLPIPTLLLVFPGLVLGLIEVIESLRTWFNSRIAFSQFSAPTASRLRSFASAPHVEPTPAFPPPDRIPAFPPSDSQTTAERSPLESRRWLLLLGIMALAVTLVIDVLPATPNHDVTRQYVFVFVGVSLLVAAAVDWIIERAQTMDGLRWRGLHAKFAPGSRTLRMARVALATILLGMTLLSVGASLRSAPWGLSYRNALLGGTSGAWNRGFEISYWGEAISPELLTAVAGLESGSSTAATSVAPRPPQVLSVPKLGYFHDAEDFWKALVPPHLGDRDVLAVDAVPAFYEKWITAERRKAEGEFLRFTFRTPPAGILFFHRRGSVADSFDEVLRHLATQGDLELVTETRIDGVSVARLYRVHRLTPVNIPGDPEHRTWYQPAWIAALSRATAPRAN